MFRSALLAVLSGAFITPALAQTPLGDVQAPDARAGEYAEVNGARIFYEAAGDGPPLVLLHGYPLSGALFAQVRDELDDTHPSSRSTIAAMANQKPTRSPAPSASMPTTRWP